MPVMKSGRERLPNRRRAETFELEVAGLRYTATIGQFPDGRRPNCAARLLAITNRTAQPTRTPATAPLCAASRFNAVPTLKPSAGRCAAIVGGAPQARWVRHSIASRTRRRTGDDESA
jgi:hypothetical protein